MLCVNYGRWIHGRCAVVNSVTSIFSGNLACRKCEGINGEVVEQEELLSNEVEIVYISR